MEGWFSWRWFVYERVSQKLAPVLWGLADGMTVAKVLGRDRYYYVEADTNSKKNVVSDISCFPLAGRFAETSHF